jgi:hypothetical protein
MLMVANWTFLASRARALPCIAHDPEVRVRDFAASRASPNPAPTAPSPARQRGGGYEVKQKSRRRNRYQTRAHLTLPEPGSQERSVGDVLALLAGNPPGRNGALLDPTDDLGRFPQLRGRRPCKTP